MADPALTGAKKAEKRKTTFRGSVVAGIAVAIPLVATAALLVFLFDLVARLLHPMFGPAFERIGLTGQVPDVALAALAMTLTLIALAIKVSQYRQLSVIASRESGMSFFQSFQSSVSCMARFSNWSMH